ELRASSWNAAAFMPENRMALTRDKLMNYLGQKLGIDVSEIDDDTPLYSSGIADSFSMVDMLIFIESEAGFKLDPTDVTLDNLDSVGRILNFVDTRTGRQLA